jgi:hypothetical protein
VSNGLYGLDKIDLVNIGNSASQDSIWKTLFIAIIGGVAVYYVPKIFRWIINRLRPILVYHFNGDTFIELDKIKHSFGKGVVDKDASNGKAWEHTHDTVGDGWHTCYGPYTKEIPFRGKYKARFRIKVCGIKEDADIITLDIAYGEVDFNREVIHYGVVSRERHLRTQNFKDGKYKNFDVEFEYDGESLLEFRCRVINPTNFTNCVDRILFDNIKVFQASELI